MGRYNEGGHADAIHQRVRESRESIVELARELIRIPSETGNEGQVQACVATHLRHLGLEVRMWDPDPDEMRAHPGYVETGADYTGRPNVVGVYRGSGSGRSLLLNGHTDVVPPGPRERWSHDPWGAEIVDGRLYGRGACDMKAAVAGMIKALELVLDMGLKPQGSVILEAVVDEEASGNGTLASMLAGYDADAAIFTEPTACAVMPAHRGASFWRIHVTGKGAHAGVMDQGVSAVEKAMLVYRALSELRARRNQQHTNHPLYGQYPTPVPLCVGTFDGGSWPSAVPEECTLQGTIEFVPGETLETVRAEFTQAVERVAQTDPWLKAHPPRIEWFGLHFPAVEVGVEEPIVSTLRDAAAYVEGRPVPVLGFPAGCDMRLRVKDGGTASVIYGPGDIGLAHAVDEYVLLDELIRFTSVIAVTIAEWCGIE